MKLPNPIVDFLRLELLYFVVNLLRFEMEKKKLLKTMPDKYIEK